MPLFPSKEWVDLYVESINASSAYGKAAATWEGDVSYVFEAEPEHGLSEDVWVWLDLWHGQCRAHRYDIAPAEGERARFVIRAPYSRWKQVIMKELDPVKGMMQGKLRLKGSLPAIIRHVRAAQELVNLAAGVPSEFAGAEPG